MPLTQIDPQSALVVIDLQLGIVGTPTATPSQEIVNRSAELARAFRAKNLPVVLVNVTGAAPGRNDLGRPTMAFAENWAELAPGLDAKPSDILITKQSWGAFLGTSLHDSLQKLGVTQIVMAGISTSAGVESTARSAFDLGYNVVFVTDAMTDRSAEAHQNSVERIFPRLGETCVTRNVIEFLAK